MSVGDGSGLILESDDGHSCMTEAVTTNDIHTSTLDPSQPTLANLINEKLDNIPVTNQEDIDHVIHVPDGKGEDESAFSAQKCTLLLFPQNGSKDMQLVQLVDGKLSVMAQQQTSDGSTLATGMPSAILADTGCMPDDWNIEDSVTCKLCKLKCDSVASRKAHEKTHSASQVFRCQYCPKTFVTSYSLKSHTRVHTNERPHPCKHCEKAFKTAGDLQKHVRTHTGERPFKCPFYGCDRSFTTSNIRKVHIRTHTGEKPYRCEKEGCEKSFASATNYRNHMRIHTGEKPYVCTVLGCNRRFTEYSSLYKHQVVHTRSKPYTCEHCQKTYRQISTLTVHRRVAHNDESRVIVDTVISSEGNNEVKVESMYGVPFAIKRGDVTVSTADRPGKELARVPQNVRLLSGSTTSSSSAVSSGVASKSTVITEPAVTIQSNAIHQHLLPGDADIDRAGHQLVTSVHQVAVTNTGECTIAMAGDQAVDNTNHAASMHSEDEEGALVINTAEPASQVSELCDVIPLESQEDQLLDMNIEAATASSSTAAPDAAAALSLPSGIATTNATTAAIANEHTVTITSDTVNEQYCQIDQSDSSANVTNEDAPPTVDQTQLLGTLQVHQGPDQKLYVFADPEQLKMFQELTDQDNGTYTVLPNTVDT